MQQSKATSYAFDKVDNNSAFWLCDFNQKIIFIKYCESQKEYLGKKGMTLDIDVFFYKLNDSIRKKSLHDCSNAMCYSCSRVTILMLPLYRQASLIIKLKLH